MSRCSNWPRLLAEFIAGRRDRPFDWATHNCCFFAADWICAMTGTDIAAEFREISTPIAAERALAAGGGLDVMMENACRNAGWLETPLTAARRGDAILADTDTGPALGVCLGARSAFVGPDGLWFVETLKCRRAWQID